ncbi:MAG: hypothetical protein ACJ702_08205 [Nitrososphaeraceae archaeon]
MGKTCWNMEVVVVERVLIYRESRIEFTIFRMERCGLNSVIPVVFVE